MLNVIWLELLNNGCVIHAFMIRILRINTIVFSRVLFINFPNSFNLLARVTK